MDRAVRSAAAQRTAQAKEMLDALLSDTEREVSSIANQFEELAKRADETLALAGRIVECLEDKGLNSVLSQIQTLGTTAKEFIHKRLNAASELIVTVQSETALIEQLADLTRGQRSVAKETNLLCVMTKIEVAHLGDMGAGFQYLAHELDSFSHSVNDSTTILAQHTEERRRASERTSRLLSTAIPRIRRDFERIEEQLGAALEELKLSMSGMSGAPARFSECIEQLSQQINGVVAALQSHDLSRQQMEHVREALTLIQEGTGVEGEARIEQIPEFVAGLRIQSYQMRNVREVMRAWVSQVRSCLDSILRVSSAEFSEIGRTTLKQDEELSSHLAWIERLEQECQADNAEILNSAAGMSELLNLVREHLERSKVIRDQMHQLNLNSIVEANHLGTEADVILEISRNIKRISGGWSELTALSEQAMEQMWKLIERTEDGLKAFSQGSDGGLKQAQEETRRGLEQLRSMAACASGKAVQIDDAAGRMREKLSLIQSTTDRLDRCVASVDAVLEEVDAALGQLRTEYPKAAEDCNPQEVERIFSRSYTSEIERKVLQAALAGDPLPAFETEELGNEVELF